MTRQESIRVLPETDENTLCVELSGLIKREDHARNVYARLEEMVKSKGRFNLLVHFTPSYKGWEEDAAALSLQSIVDFGKFAHRLAYINPPEKKIFQNKIMAPLLGGESRYFDEGRKAEAMAWVKGPD